MSLSLEHFLAEGRVPIFGGRFQPMHLGHVRILRLLLERFDHLYLGVVNPDPSSPSYPEYERFAPQLNPFSFWERHTHFSALVDLERWHGRVRIVPMWHPRKALSREENFLPGRQKRFWVVPGLDDSELAKIQDKINLGEEVVDIASELTDCDLKYRSTTIRQQIEKGCSEWQSAVCPAMVPLLRNLRRSGPYLVACKPNRWTILASTWAIIHYGHIEVIRALVRRDRVLIIGILSPERKPDDCKCGCIHDVRFTFRERMEMIMAACTELGMLDCVRIVPIYEGHDGHRLHLFNEAFLPSNRRWVFTSCDIVDLAEIEQLRASGEEVEVIGREIRTDSAARQIGGGCANTEMVPTSVVRYLGTVGGVDRLAAVQAGMLHRPQPKLDRQTIEGSEHFKRQVAAKVEFLPNHPPRVRVNGTELTLPSNRYYAILLLMAEEYTADKSAAQTHAELLLPLVKVVKSLPKRTFFRLTAEDERFVQECETAHKVAFDSSVSAKPKTPISSVLSDLRKYLKKVQGEPREDAQIAAARFLLTCIPDRGEPFKLQELNKADLILPDRLRSSS